MGVWLLRLILMFILLPPAAQPLSFVKSVFVPLSTCPICENYISIFPHKSTIFIFCIVQNLLLYTKIPSEIKLIQNCTYVIPFKVSVPEHGIEIIVIITGTHISWIEHKRKTRLSSSFLFWWRRSQTPSENASSGTSPGADGHLSLPRRRPSNSGLGSFIVHGALKALRTHVHH